jgi:hypothetical protein
MVKAGRVSPGKLDSVSTSEEALTTKVCKCLTGSGMIVEIVRKLDKIILTLICLKAKAAPRYARRIHMLDSSRLIGTLALLQIVPDVTYNMVGRPNKIHW